MLIEFYIGKGENRMLNIEEFHKAKKRLLRDKNKISTVVKLQKYVSDLELVCANEKSSELCFLLQRITKTAEHLNNINLLFRVYWQNYLQTYYYVQKSTQTEKLLKKMRNIVQKNNKIEQKSIVFLAESLLHQLKGNVIKAEQKISSAMELISPLKDKSLNTYYQILYTHTLFMWMRNHEWTEATKKMKNCLTYYYKSYNSFGLVKTITLLLRFYFFLGQDENAEELLHWTFVKERIQERIIDSHYIWLNSSVGTMYAIKNKLDEAIDSLSKTYKRIKKKNLQNEVMYEHVEIIRFLSRCYAYQGQFQHSYNLLVELISFMESDFVRTNYFSRGIKLVHLSSYYTILFIFVQLDLDISKVQDEKLRQIYEYTKSLISESRLSKDLLLDSYSDEEGTISLLNDETDKSREEVYITLHQLLITHKPYTATKKTADAINRIKNYTFDSLFADILLGKIHLAMGNFTEFKKTAENVRKKTTDEKAPILQIWSDFFTLLSKYLEEPNNLTILEELKNLEIKCSQRNFRKTANEIKLYQKLISSTRTIKKFEDRFQQTAFMDVFNEQSKKMIIEYLDEQKTS